MELTQHAYENYVACVVMIVVCFLFLALRFALRAKLHHAPLLSDWLCLASYSAFVVYCAFILRHIFLKSRGSFEAPVNLNGGGNVSLEEVKEFMKMAYVLEISFVAAVSLVKLAIMSFYWTLFSVGGAAHRWIIIGTTACCVVWCIAFTFLVIFQCHPVDALWVHLGVEEYCIQSPHLLVACEISNLFIDVLILCIPMFAVRRLNLSRKNRWSVSGIFLIGAMVCVTSVVRLTAIWRPPNVTLNYDPAKTILWSTLQVGIAIVCSVLPALGPLFSQVKDGNLSRYGDTARRRGGETGYKISDTNTGNTGRPWVDVGDDRVPGASGAWASRDDSSGESEHPLETISKSRIMVQRDVTVE
ncbi:unnamed protein product [Clonostachys rosea]|uniref:Rhodopsin domain-containing protein n=1 Tax=Bionectria ochroleuca TaxID=29856 RepID=A0ABY6UJF3_BIOOC|nr:unnamed protein product [Clonostachys rosea]